MDSQTCVTCLKPKATHQCGHCHSSVCKKCAHFSDVDDFAFLRKIPATLQHSAYCQTCYDNVVIPEKESYNKILEAARNIYVFFRGQGKEVRQLFIKRPEIVYEVEGCADYDETILRMAFYAVQDNFNVLVDVEVDSDKKYSGSYQTLKWHGKATPSFADPEKLQRQVDPKFSKW
ncbi:MAG: hypothetical protein K2Q26_06100 [Bdellovibrionales bacterium]|nr:hypothetical protein [Bdellovibrionales bacterium]